MALNTYPTSGKSSKNTPVVVATIRDVSSSDKPAIAAYIGAPISVGVAASSTDVCSGTMAIKGFKETKTRMGIKTIFMPIIYTSYVRRENFCSDAPIINITKGPDALPSIENVSNMVAFTAEGRGINLRRKPTAIPTNGGLRRRDMRNSPPRDGYINIRSTIDCPTEKATAYGMASAPNILPTSGKPRNPVLPIVDTMASIEAVFLS